MDVSFKSLPPKLFLSPNTGEKPIKPGVLWLPPIKVHSITQKIDWLSGLQISKLSFDKSQTWSEELQDTISSLNMPLDEKPKVNTNRTFLFSLPQGFKSSLGLILNDSNWTNQDDVYAQHMAMCEVFKADFFIQSIDFWGSQHIKNIDWIRV